MDEERLCLFCKHCESELYAGCASDPCCEANIWCEQGHWGASNPYDDKYVPIDKKAELGRGILTARTCPDFEREDA